MIEKMKIFGLLVLGMVLCACTLMSNTYKESKVDLVDFEPLSRKGMDQIVLIRFDIKNLTEKELNISKFSYNLKMEDIEAISGSVFGLNPVPAAATSRIEFKVTVNVFSSFRILESVVKRKDGFIEYRLSTKVSSAWWQRAVTSVKSGQIKLGGSYDI